MVVLVLTVVVVVVMEVVGYFEVARSDGSRFLLKELTRTSLHPCKLFNSLYKSSVLFSVIALYCSMSLRFYEFGFH